MKVIGPLVPDITSPETLDALCEFDFISGHGATLTKTFMIVPENTFILFIGPSGFQIGPADINDSLLGGLSEEPREVYMARMFNEFISGQETMRPYNKSFVYTPGDIIHNTAFSFTIYPTASVFFKMGLFPLPSPWLGALGSDSNIEIMPFLLWSITDNPKLLKIIDTASVKDSVKEEWKTIMEGGDADERIARYEAIRKAFIERDENKLDMRLITNWFEYPGAVAYDIIIPYAINKYYGNKLKSGKNTRLSDMLQTYTSEKKYRFIMVGACRAPSKLSPNNAINMTYYNQWPIGNRAIVNRIQSRKLVRRGSFTLKGYDVCFADAAIRPMNISYIKQEVQKLVDRGFTFNIDEGLNANDPKVTIPQLLKYFFIIKDGTVEYRPEMSIARFGEAIETINKVFGLYFDRRNAENARMTELERKLISLNRALYFIFEAYQRGIGYDYGIRNPFKKSIVEAATSHTFRGGRRRLRNITRRKRRKN